jgi:alanine racemase
MTFTLYVDGPRWRAHAEAEMAQTPGLVPVAKGNGYGFGRERLAAEAAALGVAAVAVGQAGEIESVRAGFGGDVLVMAPYLPGVDAPAGPDDAVVRTAATLDGLRALAGHRVVVELLTSMQRFGLAEGDLAGLGQAGGPLGDVRLEGFSVHLPLVQGDRTSVAEADLALARLRRAGLAPKKLWVSHLTPAELAQLASRHADVAFKARVGTRLWLGDRGAAQAKATVLAVHPLKRGERYGYRQRRATRAGTLVVVGAGTSHGVALSAPNAAQGLRQRTTTLAVGSLEAFGRALSPFSVEGSQRWFAEPPHMQVSMLWLPDDVAVPTVGTELDTDVRMTTTTFDRIVVSD